MIVSAAIREGSLVYALPAPARHHDIIRYMVHERSVVPPVKGTQGFIDSDRGFVGREQAMDIAEAMGQLKEPANSTQLFTEDLW